MGPPYTSLGQGQLAPLSPSAVGSLVDNTARSGPVSSTRDSLRGQAGGVGREGFITHTPILLPKSINHK